MRPALRPVCVHSAAPAVSRSRTLPRSPGCVIPEAVRPALRPVCVHSASPAVSRSRTLPPVARLCGSGNRAARAAPLSAFILPRLRWANRARSHRSPGCMIPEAVRPALRPVCVHSAPPAVSRSRTLPPVARLCGSRSRAARAVSCLWSLYHVLFYSVNQDKTVKSFSGQIDCLMIQ